MARLDCFGKAGLVQCTKYVKENLQEAKKRLRRAVKDQLPRESPASRAEASVRACVLAQEQRIWRESRCIMFYAALPNELNLDLLLKLALASGKLATLPRFHSVETGYQAHQVNDFENDLGKGRFDICEPNERCPAIPLNAIDLAFVPGVAFDLQGRRLGRGKGYYDRLLSQIGGLKCGVAYDIQIQETVPVETHDVPVDFILTPTRFCAVRPAGPVLS